MNDRAPKLNRKRRRWINAGVLSFVLGVAGWWYWPRGDARFVGSWKIFPLYGDTSCAGRIVLRSNGSAEGEFGGFRPAVWQVMHPQGGKEILSLEDLAIRLPGGLAQSILFSVHSLDNDKITLGIDPQALPEIALIRVPE